MANSPFFRHYDGASLKSIRILLNYFLLFPVF